VIVTFAIGNSDDKLSQAGWSAFVGAVHAAVDQAVQHGARIQFAGYSAPGAPWQNALWAVEIPGYDWDLVKALRAALRGLAKAYRQDSIAWWSAGEVDMLEPAV
jgi:hypothetical protein